MKALKIIFPLVCSLLIVSCYNDPIDVTVPLFEDGGFITTTTPLPTNVKTKLEGVYSVVTGSDQFGSTVVMKIAGNRISIFTGKNVGYFILQSGSIDSALYLEGYWRYQVNTETGLVSLSIVKNEG